MNRASVKCCKFLTEISILSQSQLVIITVINVILMAGNITINTLVIYILTKTKQIGNITCKLIFVLSVLNITIGLFSQNLLTIALYGNNCLFETAYRIISELLFHISMYLIAIIGIDRYLRIKYYMTFKVIWTPRVVSILISIGFAIAISQAIVANLGFLIGREHMAIIIYYATDVLILSAIIFLQILTIRTSNAVRNVSPIVTSGRSNNKIRKLSIRIMLFLCIFIAPNKIMFVLHNIIQDELNDYGKSIFEFIMYLSELFVFANSFANAALFLVTNAKAEKLLRKINAEKRKRDSDNSD